MRELEKYIKKKQKSAVLKNTSINIELEQYNFVNKNNLNLSKMVRDMLTYLMKNEAEESEESDENLDTD